MGSSVESRFVAMGRVRGYQVSSENEKEREREKEKEKKVHSLSTYVGICGDSR